VRIGTHVSTWGHACAFNAGMCLELIGGHGDTRVHMGACVSNTGMYLEHVCVHRDMCVHMET